MFSVVTRNKSSVVIERHISFPAKPVEHGQEAKMLFVDPCPDEFDNRDVMPWLTPGAETVAEHEPQGSLQHCFVGLLEAGLFVESENLLCASFFSALCKKRSICAQSTFCGLSFFTRHSGAKPAYCARRFRGRHLSDFGVTRILSRSRLCN